MYGKKLCLGLDFGLPYEEQLLLVKEAGFEAFFVNWARGMELKGVKELAEKEGMIFQSIHAPYTNSKYFWENGEKTQDSIDELIECIQVCAENEVPLMIVHAFIGFEDHDPNETGLVNFEKVVREAKKCGVKIAFENTEGEEYLDALMEYFKDYDNVGFCWDTGHELCYNRGRNMIASYGDRLFGTHLNDNLGIKDFDGNITWIDDLHLLPFDGITDWNSVAKRLNGCGYDGILTFELVRGSKPDRHENDKYQKMELKEYLAEVYSRACRVAALMQKPGV